MLVSLVSMLVIALVVNGNAKQSSIKELTVLNNVAKWQNLANRTYINAYLSQSGYCPKGTQKLVSTKWNTVSLCYKLQQINNGSKNKTYKITYSKGGKCPRS
jgi:hypothetical protein